MSTIVTDKQGRELKLGGTPQDHGPGKNPLCCNKARYIKNHKGDGPFGPKPGPYACVCFGKSYCPEHGIQCNGSHD